MGERGNIAIQRFTSDRRVLRVVFFLFITVWTVTGLFLIGEILSYLLLDYPFNDYEPEVIMEAWRLSEGDIIYMNPEQGPHAGIYAPLTQLVLAGLFQILPSSLLVARLLSFFSLLLVGYMSVRWAKARSMAHILFIFTMIFIWHEKLLHFELHGKPDSFAILLVITAAYFIYKFWNHNGKVAYLALSALAMALSVAAKQNMLFALPAILLALLLYRANKSGILYIGYFVLFSAAIWSALYVITGSYLFYYTFDLPGEFPFRWARLFSGSYQLFGNLWIAAAAGAFTYRWYKEKLNFGDTLLLLLLLFAWPACIMTFAKGGGLSNAFLPFYLLLSIYVTIHLPWGRLWGNTRRHLLAITPFSRYYTGGLLLLILAMLTTVQINPPGLITTYQHRFQAKQKYNELVEDLKATPGGLYAPFDNYLSLRAGKPLWYSRKNQRDLSITGITPEVGYREIALNYINVVTTHKSYAQNSIEQFLRNNNYYLVKKYPTQQSFTYYWWKQIDYGPHSL